MRAWCCRKSHRPCAQQDILDQERAHCSVRSPAKNVSGARSSRVRASASTAWLQGRPDARALTRAPFGLVSYPGLR
jgi:hypothetical protein